MEWNLGVIGSPISHSLSPELQLEALKIAGLTGTSQRYEVSEADFPAFIATASESFDGLSVTAPLKTLAFERVSEVTESARAAEAVNSLRFEDGKIIGNNTDGEGFLSAATARFNIDFSGAHVAVLGAGGSARAIIHALVKAGVASIAVHGRSEANVERACKPYSNVYGFSLVYRPVDVIINTIPSASRIPEASVLQGITPDSFAIDITYEPRMSEWLSTYERFGCQTDNGLRMLSHQAAAQMQWWLGREFDGEMLLKVIS